MNCKIHYTPMEWIPNQGSFLPGGFWFCQDCWDDEEEINYRDDSDPAGNLAIIDGSLEGDTQ